MARPFALDPLFRALTALPGIGPRNVKLLEKLVGGPKILDLLWHKPIDLVDRRFTPKIAEAPDGRVSTLSVQIHKHFPNERKGQPYKIWCTDETGTINLVFFHAHRAYLEKLFPIGETRIVSGAFVSFTACRMMFSCKTLSCLNAALRESKT